VINNNREMADLGAASSSTGTAAGNRAARPPLSESASHSGLMWSATPGGRFGLSPDKPLAAGLGDLGPGGNLSG